MRLSLLTALVLATLAAPVVALAQENNIVIGGGVSSDGRYLSVTTDGNKADLYSFDDFSGRQRWIIENDAGGFVHIRIASGVPSDRKYLSVTTDGNKVDLYGFDDGSGRQRWIIENDAGGFVRIRIAGGVSNDRKYLSVTTDGSKADLYGFDDGSGRQRWNITPAVPRQPKLTRGYLNTKTGDEDKDHNTCVWVVVRTSDGSTQLAHIEGGDCSDDERTGYNDRSSHTITMVVDMPGATFDSCEGFTVHLWQKTHGGAGHDRWDIDLAEVTLFFADGKSLVARKDHFRLESRSENDSPSVDFSATAVR